MDGAMMFDRQWALNPYKVDVLSTGLYIVEEEFSVMRVRWPYPRDESPFTFRSIRLPVLRDANATAGTWWQAITLNHRGVVWNGAEIYAFEPELHDMPGEYVPLFEGDPERAVWRRRKWWGDGPVKPFSPWGAWCTQWTFTIPVTLRGSTSYPCRSVES